MPFRPLRSARNSHELVRSKSLVSASSKSTFFSSSTRINTLRICVQSPNPVGWAVPIRGRSLYQKTKLNRSLRSVGLTIAVHPFHSNYEHDFVGRVSFGEADEPPNDTPFCKAQVSWLHSRYHVTQWHEAFVKPMLRTRSAIVIAALLMH